MSDDYPTVRLVEITGNTDGQRLDNFLMAQLRGVPKSMIYRIIRKGEVRINGSRCKPASRVYEGDKVRIPPVRTRTEKPVARAGRDVVAMLESPLHEDDDLMILNKPSGLAVHGGTGIESGLIEQLRVVRPELEFVELAHRLDKDTSGCLVLAKSRAVLLQLHAALRGDEARVEKRYLALVRGAWPQKLRIVDSPVSEREARSIFHVRTRYTNTTLVEVELLTGRNHQVRVHAADSGHPVVGDTRHGDFEFNRELRKLGVRRLFLHASELGFMHPGRLTPITVKAPLPAALSDALGNLNEFTDP